MVHNSMAIEFQALMRSDSSKGILLALIAAMLAAVFLVPFKMASDQMDRDLASLALLFVAAILNSLMTIGNHTVSASSKRRLPPEHTWRVTVLVSIVLGIFTVSGNIGLAAALVRIDPGVTSVVQQTQVLLVSALAAVFLRERISLRFVVGTIIAMSGFAIIHLLQDNISAVNATGTLWALLSAVSFAIMQVVTRGIIHRIDPVMVNALRLWVSVALLACFPGILGELFDLGSHVWLLICIAAFVGPFIARISLMYSLRFISASNSILLSLASPIFAFVFGFFAFGIVPTPYQILGSALILIGIGLPVVELAQSAMPRQT